MSLGLWEVLVILVIVLVLFGAGKLPKVMADLGKGARLFRHGLEGKEGEPAKPAEPTTDQQPPR